MAYFRTADYACSIYMRIWYQVGSVLKARVENHIFEILSSRQRIFAFILILLHFKLFIILILIPINGILTFEALRLHDVSVQSIKT